MNWQPLLRGTAAEAVRVTYTDVVAALAVTTPCAHVCDELADRAILLAYGATGGALVDDGRAGDWIGRLVDRVASGGLGPELFGGVARVGWTLMHLTRGEDVAATCAAFDDVLAKTVGAGNCGYDLVNGLVGIGVYALERGDAGEALATAVVAELERRAEPRGAGRAWRSGTNYEWDLGVAHGVAGVIGFLGRASASGIVGARTLLDDAAAYLSSFAPRYPAHEGAPPRSRLAWCYGDLGVALALVGAGLWVDFPAWREQGIAVALDCARRDPADADVYETTVCHGAFGVAHVFNRIAQATDRSELADAARAWCARALAMRGTEALQGFAHKIHDNAEPSLAAKRAGTLLYGAAGVGLVLDAFISSCEPSWDRLLLADMP